jgi:hypothetical protein
MQRFLLSLLILAALGDSQARAEFRQIDLSIFGMD